MHYDILLVSSLYLSLAIITIKFYFALTFCKIVFVCMCDYLK